MWPPLSGGILALPSLSLTPGTRLGPYEIIGAIGAGAMGEVYRARDTKLNRDVAIKVLPELLARDPERLTRFTREAQSLAALNHANIAQVFGVLEEPSAVVMEFVDGEDLAHRLERGAVTVDDAIPIALQTASGLEAAHERGIVHRDLKPANIRMTPDGSVKILDFGLAKAIDPLGGSGATALDSPTFTSPATMMGMIIGTAAYMAPEQARGKPVDKRADIWAFGVVLYEMLTAKRPFGGETITDALAAIVKEEPDWSALPSSTPGPLRRLIAQCLVKDAKQRLRDIGDARIVLERIAAGAPEERTAAVSAPVAATGGRFGLAHLVAAALSLALVASLVTWWVVRPAPAAPAALLRFVTPLPPEAAAVRGNGNGVAYAPDGSSIVYTSQAAGQPAPVLFRRQMNAVEPELIPNTVGAFAPFFSPDGKWIGFFTERAVMKLSLDGRGLSKVCDRGPFSRASWAPDDTIVLGTSQAFSPGSLGRVPAGGGTPAPLTTLTGKETLHQFPRVLPDGRHVIFTAISPGRADIAVASLADGSHELLNLEGSGPVFVPPDRLLFAREDAMFAVPFDPKTRKVTGSPVQVLEDAAVFAGGLQLRTPIVGVDDAGSVAYLNRRTLTSVLAWMDPAGRMTTLNSPASENRYPRLSPDGRRLAMVTAQGFVPDIWIVDLERGTRLRLTSSYGLYPVWSSDGSRIVYADRDKGILSVAADASGMPELLLARDASQIVFPTSSPADGTIVFTAEDRGAGRGTRNRDIWKARRGEKPQPLLQSGADEHEGVVSPDGRWLAYVSSASGRDEIYVRSFEGTGGTIPVSSEGGASPIWSRKGDALYFRSGARLMRAPVAGTPLQIRAPVVAQSLPPGTIGVDVAPDGRVLVVIRQDNADSRDFLHVLLNWSRTLR
jgi:Tol biopolymer transport system component/tRNA A-37 threonylcarbamoyl transferase component Bud32